MLIEQPDNSLTSPYEIRDHKTRLVLDWLHAFRFSSLSLLAQRLDSSRVRSQRIFKSLFQANYIQYFLNDYTYRKRFVMLTPTGANFLHQSTGRDVSAAVTQTYRLTRYHNILHDLAVQQAAIRRLDHYKELIADHHITIPEPFHRPDILMLNHKDFWIAYEYERSRKQIKCVYVSFNNHAQAIIKRHYHATYFLFDHESDLDFYQNLFDAKEWPQYDYNRSTGKTTEKKTPFQPDTFTNLRKCFLFIHEAADPTAP